MEYTKKYNFKTSLDSIVKFGADTVKRLYQESDLDNTLALFR